MSREDPQIKLRLPIELKRRIEISASEHARSMNAEVVLILQKYFDDLDKDVADLTNNLALVSIKKSISEIEQSIKNLSQTLK